VKVSALALGGMNFGPFGGTTQDEVTSIVRQALDAGVNVIDTADVYSDGASEELIGRALTGVSRSEVFLATKFGLPFRGRSGCGGSRRWIIEAVEASLRRLGTDYIDLYQMHRPDPDTDIGETLAALTHLQAQGKVRYIGSSTFSGAEIVEAQWESERQSLARFVCEQPPYSILARSVETEVLPTARKHGLGIMVWSPLAGGYLSGRYRPGAAAQPSHRDLVRMKMGRAAEAVPEDELKHRAAEELFGLAGEAGLSLIEMALAFAIRHPAVTSATLGPRTVEQLQSQLPAADVVLSDDVLDRIDQIVAPGRTLKPADDKAVSPALAAANRRR
ncbi:aldo/keto reductase, partial [Georgenia ruanii]|nr:aldo/keto reductase [Georgenia ruanii]